MVKRLTLNDVGVAYGKRRILDGITTPTMAGGEVVAVIGPNAAGKSSLFRRIAGLIPGAGKVQVESTSGKTPCYLPQDTAVNAVLTVYESILLARTPMTRANVASRARGLPMARTRQTRAPGGHIAGAPSDRRRSSGGAPRSSVVISNAGSLHRRQHRTLQPVKRLGCAQISPPRDPRADRGKHQSTAQCSMHNAQCSNADGLTFEQARSAHCGLSITR